MSDLGYDAVQEASQEAWQARQLELFHIESVQVEAFRVHCFFQPCTFVVTETDPDQAHGHMEAHYEVAHRPDLERLHKLGYIGPLEEKET